MELGIYTFAEMTSDASTKSMITTHERIQNLMHEIEMAEQVGLDVYAVGEHHRPDFAVSSPAVILGAAAVATRKIKLSSAVTVLSSDDPVRVYQDFATVDQLSSGRAEIMAGRGSFIESFPLFGYDLRHYDELFAEKLDLLMKVNAHEKVSWDGKHRSAINNLGVYPRAYQTELPIWVAIGGTPESISRAATLGLPMALAIIGGMPHRFVPHVRLYRDLFLETGHSADNFQLGINSHAFVADTSQKASDDFYPSYALLMNRIGKERGWPAMDREQYETLRSPQGSLLVGSPQEVIDKILYEHELFGHTRFLAQMSVGTIPHDKLMRSIELFGTVVAPAVRKALRK
jgi:probable LLM family oxidoreductase